MNKILPTNFIYPVIPPTVYKFGANNFIDVPLRDDGDWRDYLPPGELQTRHGVESSSCYIEGSQHAIAVILEEQFELKDQNYSERFNALLSNGSPQGGDPLAGAESIRKRDGLIPDYMLPFADYINSWSDFHSFKGGNETVCRQAGQNFLRNWKLNYDIVSQREDKLDDKFSKLKQALKYSPCPISVYGVVDSNGNYIEKPQGAGDTHLVLAVYVDKDNFIWVFDTYIPFLKKLPQTYNSDFAMRWSVSRLESIKVAKKSWWQRFLELLEREKLIFNHFKNT